MFTSTYGAGIFKSTDNGATWTAANAGLGNLFVQQIIVVKNTYLLAATNAGGIYKSTDNGTTWRQVYTGPGTNTSVNCLAAGTNTLWAGGSASIGILLSTNDGEMWTSVRNAGWQTANIISITAKGNTVFAGSNSAIGIATSSDNGQNWTYVNTGLKYSFIQALTTVGNSVVASTDFGVFITNNNGVSWTEANTGLVQKLVLSFLTYDNHLWVGTFGGGVWKRPLSELNLVNSVKDIAETPLTIYPNPVGQFLNIKELDSKKKISIYNINGQLIDNQYLIQNNRLDVSALQQGSYILKLEDDKTIMTGKFVKL